MRTNTSPRPRAIHWLYSVALGFTFSAALANEIAIKAGAILDPVSATMAQNQTILVEDGKIKAIGNNLTVALGSAVGAGLTLKYRTYNINLNV